MLGAHEQPFLNGKLRDLYLQTESDHGLSNLTCQLAIVSIVNYLLYQGHNELPTDRYLLFPRLAFDSSTT